MYGMKGSFERCVGKRPVHVGLDTSSTYNVDYSPVQSVTSMGPQNMICKDENHKTLLNADPVQSRSG
ncbi:hypothetical protein PV04_06113 [Phialophora macrospora]|uniref:Uncharacterized protein n=1 Tax=Phialophora macrospora TaxID=1851006 RepID=A0A0D2G417_9EURO|nr:hypothetical protein PV04_06113 [Phialophora macrospora]